MRIKTNIHALDVYNNYRKNNISNSKALKNLSSGQKINGSKDNPNKLGQSEQMRMQIRGLQMAEKNLQDTNSMIQTADSSLQEVNDMLGRIKELLVQGSNDALSQSEKDIIQSEINQMKEQIDNTSNNSEFNKVNILNNSLVDNNNYPEYIKVTEGASAGESINIPVFNISTNIIGDGRGNSVASISLGNVDEGLKAVDGAINEISGIRSKYGAIQSRIESTINTLQSKNSSLENADSLIRDADIALEMVEFSRTSILQEASIAILKQSNQFPQDIINILSSVHK